MILVTGATGKVGGATARKLAEAGAPIRVMARDPAKAGPLAALGRVEIVEGDFARPASLDAALAGIDKVFLLPPDDLHMVELQLAMVEACKRARVTHVVKLSGIGAVLGEHSIMDAHAQGDAALKASGLPYTILYANSFMQNLITFFAPEIAATGAFRFCTRSGVTMAKVDARDVGAVAAAVLTQSGHEGASYDVTGPEALSFDAMAEKISAALGEPVAYVPLSNDEYLRESTAAGLPAWIADVLVGLYGTGGWYGEGRAAAVADTVQRLTGEPPRTFGAFAREHAAAFRTHAPMGSETKA